MICFTLFGVKKTLLWTCAPYEPAISVLQTISFSRRYSRKTYVIANADRP